MFARSARSKRGRRAVRRTLFEALEPRWMLTAPWQNSCNGLDASGDGLVVPLDALALINELNAGGGQLLPPPSEEKAPPPFYDVNGDGFLVPGDVLIIINALNGNPSDPFFQFEGGLVNDTAPDGQTNTDESRRILGSPALCGLRWASRRCELQVDEGAWEAVPHACGVFQLDPGLLGGWHA